MATVFLVVRDGLGRRSVAVPQVYLPAARARVESMIIKTHAGRDPYSGSQHKHEKWRDCLFPQLIDGHRNEHRRSAPVRHDVRKKELPKTGLLAQMRPHCRRRNCSQLKPLLSDLSAPTA